MRQNWIPTSPAADLSICVKEWLLSTKRIYGVLIYSLLFYFISSTGNTKRWQKKKGKTKQNLILAMRILEGTYAIHQFWQDEVTLQYLSTTKFYGVQVLVKCNRVDLYYHKTVSIPTSAWTVRSIPVRVGNSPLFLISFFPFDYYWCRQTDLCPWQVIEDEGRAF